MPPTYVQFYDSLETLVVYASRYGTADFELVSVKLNDFFTSVVVNATGDVFEDSPPVDFNQFAAALDTIAQYCQEQKIPSTEDTNLILGNGVKITLTTEWAVAGAFDTTTIQLTATRQLDGLSTNVGVNDGTFSKSNVVA